MIQCPICGWFLSDVKALITYLEFGDLAIEKVVGNCKRCGVVEPTNWCFDDFFPDGESLRAFEEELRKCLDSQSTRVAN